MWKTSWVTGQSRSFTGSYCLLRPKWRWFPVTGGKYHQISKTKAQLKLLSAAMFFSLLWHRVKWMSIYELPLHPIIWLAGNKGVIHLLFLFCPFPGFLSACIQTLQLTVLCGLDPICNLLNFNLQHHCKTYMNGGCERWTELIFRSQVPLCTWSGYLEKLSSK